MRVAVLAGGRSSERDVSLKSACSVLDGLAERGHEVEPIVIGEDGIWRRIDPRADEQAARGPVAIVPGGGRSALLHVESDDDEGSDIDVVFPVLHGPYGEDGTVQGLLECIGVPYVGAGVLASGLCTDKVAFKVHIAQAGIDQPRYLAVSNGEWSADVAKVNEKLKSFGLPLFVKPARLGSSVGISKVMSSEELSSSVDAAFAHDSKVIIEQAIDGMEVECSVIGNDQPVASLPGEIKIANDWYDFEAKYDPGGMELVVPAELSQEVIEEIRAKAVEVYRACDCEGMGRIDFFISDEDRVIVSELNTIPGFTKTSVFSRLFEASGVTYIDLLDKLLALALDRFQRERQYSH